MLRCASNAAAAIDVSLSRSSNVLSGGSSKYSREPVPSFSLEVCPGPLLTTLYAAFTNSNGGGDNVDVDVVDMHRLVVERSSKDVDLTWQRPRRILLLCSNNRCWNCLDNIFVDSAMDSR